MVLAVYHLHLAYLSLLATSTCTVFVLVPVQMLSSLKHCDRVKELPVQVQCCTVRAVLAIKQDAEYVEFSTIARPTPQSLRVERHLMLLVAAV